MLTFVNRGNTCWFNSALQVVLHVPQIANIMRNDIFQKMLVLKRKNASDFALELSKIATKYWSTDVHEEAYDVGVLLELFTKINRNFGGRKMYDASECFLKILDTLETAFVVKPPFPLPPTCNSDAWEEHMKKTNSTFLSDVFMGQAKQTYKDSVTYEHFNALTISGVSSVEKGIENYRRDYDVGITREFTKLPMILPILFQKTAEKHFVHYDVTLTIDDCNYVLFAILLHQNNHWVAMANAGSWYLFDDDKSTRIYDMNVLIQKDAMLLLYKRHIVK